MGVQSPGTPAAFSPTNYRALTTERFLADVASDRAAPAGVSAAAVTGALGAALCEMACIHTLEVTASSSDSPPQLPQSVPTATTRPGGTRRPAARRRATVTRRAGRPGWRATWPTTWALTPSTRWSRTWARR
ncbi:cyclodeaminase/cyclohydrolase family protein [Halolamina sediminis]|uniref:cyclodeaminase/cyclohydrolase family protein n=1 Tax=Halolamina sediminis TaxID=1480675 RepID=UPI0032AF64E9